jgi:hypothetical protein
MIAGNTIVFYDHGEVEERILVNWSDIHHFIHASELDMGVIELPDGVHVLVYDRNAMFDKYAMINHSANMFLTTLEVELDDYIYGTALIVVSEAFLNLEA